MCKYLIGKHNTEPKVAERDIEVFKIVKKIKDGVWYGLYQTSYSAPTNTKLVAEGDSTPVANSHNWICLEDGWFHSCANMNAVMARASANSVVVKAIIPKGSTYYRSKVGNDICSKELIVTDEVIDSDKWEGMRERPEVLEVSEVEGKRWLHVKDNEHEVYIALRTECECTWDDAMEKYDLPSTDDWELVIKYLPEIREFIEANQDCDIEGFDSGWYWSSGEYNSANTWFYYGINGRLYVYGKYYTFRVRPVLAQKL